MYAFSTDSNNLTAYISIAAAGTLLIVLIILSIYVRKLKKKTRSIKTQYRRRLSNDSSSSDDFTMDDKYDNIPLRRRKSQKSSAQSRKSVNRDLQNQALAIPYDSKREIPRESFTVIEKIGSGNFGTVAKGELTGLFSANSKTMVAIKSMKGNGKGPEMNDFLKEIKIMSYIKPHLNLVSMIGSCASCTEYQRELWLILEYCKHGDLRIFLVQNKGKILSSTDDQFINEKLLLNFIHDISKGMEHLFNNKIMHGDLAARNIFLDIDPLETGRPVAKVGDFGLSKKFDNKLVYEKESRVHVPWKWIAMEYLVRDYFTLTSDVWSFGVVVWEILSFGRLPYGRAGYNEVFAQLEDGYRLPCPSEVKHVSQWSPEILYKDLSTLCFKADPEDRATFPEVVKIIEKHFTADELQLNAQMSQSYESKWCIHYLKLGSQRSIE